MPWKGDFLYVLYVFGDPLDKPKGVTRIKFFADFVRFGRDFYTFYTFCHDF